MSELSQMLPLFGEALQAVADQVAVLDEVGQILFVNSAWTQFTVENGGRPEATGPGVNYLNVCLSGTRPTDDVMNQVNTQLQSLLAGRLTEFEIEYPCHSPTEERWFLLRAKRLPAGQFLISHTDVSARRLAQRELARQVEKDPVTGLLTRRALSARLSTEVERARQDHIPVTALLVDADGFTEINHRIGTAGGDLVLAELARRLCEGLRPHDVLARINADTFVVVLPGVGVSEAAGVAERLRSAASQRPYGLSHGLLSLTVSVAVVGLEHEGLSLDELLRRAEPALAESRQVAKNRTVKAAPAGEGDFGEALGRLWVASHDIHRLDGSGAVAAELLIRGPPGPWQRPDMLFRAAIEADALSMVDRVCAQRCLSVAAHVQRARLHVNVYPSTLLALPASTIASWVPSSVGAHRVCLEVNEQQLLGEATELLPAVQQLREHGFSISIDDVGFGRTSLEHLVVLQPEVVKIDRRFGSGLANKDKARTLQRLLRVLHSLDGSEIVVEGVERKEDAELLASWGVTFAQGFWWGEPKAVSVQG